MASKSAALNRINATMRLGTRLLVCERDECQAIVQEEHSVWILRHGEAFEDIVCSMKCAAAFSSENLGRLTIKAHPQYGGLVLGWRDDGPLTITLAGMRIMSEEEP